MRATSVFFPRTRSLVATFALALICCVVSEAQSASPSAMQAAAPRPLITQPIDEAQLTTLRGNTHPLARPEFDLGTAPASLPLQRMLLVLKRSPEQESALGKLLDDQQNKTSPSYHQWLTPDQFGQQFGPTDADIQTVTTWLQSHGFQVSSTKGRTVMEFSGSASQVQEAFHTTIHKYLIKDEQHWANSTDPQIPAALAPAVAGVSSLNNFPRHPMSVFAGKFSREKATGKITAIQPEFTFPFGCAEDNSSNNACLYALGPYDFATIYNVLPLWNLGINGTGQTIAIVGETNINPQDVADFRNLFGLPTNSVANGNPLNIILNGPDPGIQGDESEADIDVQWSGAVAPNATIDFVISQSTETTAGTDLSAVYIVENNLAPVMSESYGFCELGLGTTGNQFFNALWQQAAAQGITVFISAGDNGAAGCDDFNASSPAPAQFGLQVSGYASTPYNVAVGGTDFNDFTNPSMYWNLSNTSTTQASAKGYIPESTWNDSCTNAIFGTVGFSTVPETNCNDSRLIPFYVVPEGGSGGVSKCTTPTGLSPSNCAGGYGKPIWQTGTSVPNDGKRDLPDVSLFASNGFLGSFYIICESDQAGPCSLQAPYSNFLGFGGTSVSSPAFAGIMALVNQQMVAQGLSGRQGNANYIFYKLAAEQPTAFHDVTTGTIAMPCLRGSPNCTTTNSSDQYGVMTGYNAGIGYDLATGLGSVNAQNLVNKWNSVATVPSATTLNSLTPTTITHGQAVNFSVTVKPQSGSGTPTGTISLLGGPSNSSQGIAGFNLSSGTVSGSTDLLPGGTYSVTAHYPGDGTYEPSDSSAVSVTVSKEGSELSTFLVTFDFNGNTLSTGTNTAVYGSPYLLRVNVANSSGVVCTPVTTAGATGCPTGSVTLTDNGAALDAGTFALNTFGYFEDQTVQLPGGTNSIKAQYPGDNSFTASTATQGITITPAPTTEQAPVLTSGAGVGSIASFASTVQSSPTTGAEPTGTVTFSSNGVPLAGTVNIVSGAGGSAANNFTASATAVITTTTSPFPTPGTYVITAAYGGDGNYQGSTSSPTTIVVMFPTPTVTMQASSASVSAGSSVTLTAIVTGASKTIAPTGTITFGGYEGAVPGTVSYSNITDPNSGNLDLQGTITITPLFSDLYSAQYSGDPNFPSAQTAGFVLPVTVTGNDFSLLTLPQQNSITVQPGGTGSLELLAGLQSATAPVSFAASACSGLPSETTCSISPNPVPSTGGFLVQVSTTAPHATAVKQTGPVSRNVMPTTLVPFAAILLIGVARRRAWRGLVAGLALGVLLLGLGCGGSSGNNGGGGGGGGFNDPGTPKGTYTITVTGTSASISHSTTFTLIVQ